MTSHPVVLVVDDDQSLLRLLDTTLRVAGYRVLSASRPWVALHLLKTHRPHVLVLDHMMPEMDGETLCGKARQEGYRGQVLMLSAWSAGADAAKRIGARFMAKPFDPDALSSEVDALINQGLGQEGA
jgi:DNA-binding response OmpR family regulator